MERFKALQFEPHPNDPDGIRAVMDFPNGYQASVIRNLLSWGNEDGLYELTVMREGVVVYDTSITSDMEGWQTEEGIDALLGAIFDLPSATT